MMKKSTFANNESDSDSDFSLDGKDYETKVDVGVVDDDFSEFTDDEKLQSKIMLRSPYFVSKLGGKPSWLSYSNLPSPRCTACESQLTFLLQIYAPITDTDKNHSQIESINDSFHRVLFVFICNQSGCSARTFKVYRSQLNRLNEYYSFEAPPSYDDGLDEVKKYLVEFYEKIHAKNLFNLCTVCGMSATKKCAKCVFSFYCSQAHQVFDWQKNNHKEVCSKYQQTEPKIKFDIFVQNENSPAEKERTGSVFPEYEILIEPEVIDFKKDHKKNEYKYDEKKLAEDLEMNLNMDQDNDLDNLKETETDKDFEKFKKITNNQSEQIIRYERGGQPLWVTKHNKLNEKKIPCCTHCGSERIFEFQVNPQLLCFLGLEDDLKQLNNSIDWAGLYVYTCLRNCTAANTSYCEEFIYKQEFSC